jgi:hypothetical protein
MAAFHAALNALFADLNLTAAATFAPADGTPLPVRVIARRPDRIIEFGDARLRSTAAMFDLRISEVAEPRPGDRLEVGGESYVIQGEPVRDAERLVWIVSAVPL